jgi:tetratricopeptide (TPR) repeat protein
MKLKYLVLQSLLYLALPTLLFADEPESFSITTNQAMQMQRRLNAYEKGQINIHDLNENASEEENRELIGFYLLHTNELSLKDKLAVGRSYSYFRMFPEAIQLTAEYLNVYSNDFHAWNVLGSCYMGSKSFDKAIDAYTNSVRLGDKMSYISLVGAALLGGRWEIVQGAIPKLLELKKSDHLSQDDEHNMLVILLSYSIKFEQEDIFVKALDGVSSEQISSEQDSKWLVTSGCQLFKGKKIDGIRKKLEAAEAKDSNSTTNAPSP